MSAFWSGRSARVAILAALLGSAAPAALAQAVTTNAPRTSGISQEEALSLSARLDALEQRNAELEAQVAALKAQMAAGQKAVHEEVRAQPTVSLANGRPTITTADGRFSTTLHGIVQLDTAAYDQASPGPVTTDLRRSGPALGATASNVDLARARNLKSGVLFRRARIGMDGKAFGDWQYRLIFDFGSGAGVENAGQLFETWIQYDGLKPAHIRIGAFPPSLGMDDQGSVTGMPFLERSAIGEMARALAGGDTRTAAQVFGYGDHWLAAAAVTGRTIGAINTGTGAGTPQTFGDQLGFTGRIAGTPFRGEGWMTHVGLHGSYAADPPNTGGPAADGSTPLSAHVIAFGIAPENRVDATKLINTGNIPARHASTLGAEFAAQRRNLLLQAEYERLGVERSDGLSNPHFDGFYLEGTWVITGEPRAYNSQTAAFDAPTVAHPFSFGHGGWGAWEAALRYADADLNFQAGADGTLQSGASIRGGEQKAWTAGVNWYWNAFARVMLDYQRVKIDRLSPASSLASASTIWLTPPGAQIGQSFNIWSIRTQFAF